MAFEGTDSAPRGPLGVAAVEVVSPRLSVVEVPGQQVIGGDEQGVGHGDDGFERRVLAWAATRNLGSLCRKP